MRALLKTWWVCLGVISLAGGMLIAVIVWLWLVTPRISEEQVEMIQVGMSLGEVEAILGCRPGNYTDNSDLLPIEMDPYSLHQQQRRKSFKEWATYLPEQPTHTDSMGRILRDSIGVRVWFDEHGKVIDKCRMGYTYHFRSISDRLREWLERVFNRL